MPIFKQIAQNSHSKRAFKESRKLQPNTFEPFAGPDGEYMGRLKSQTEKPNGEATMAFFNYEITEWDYKGKEVSHMYWLAKEKDGSENQRSYNSMQISVGLMGGDGSKDPEYLDDELGKIIRGKKSFRLKIATTKDNKGIPRTKCWPAYSPSMLDVQKKMKEKEVVEEKKVVEEVEEETEEYDGAALNGMTVSFQDEDCLVLKRDTKSKIVQLGDPNNKKDIWYEDIKVSQLTIP